MRVLSELIETEDPAFPMVQAFAAEIPGRCVILPPSSDSGEVLVRTQVTTRSPMGAIVYHSGGIIVDQWLRILGSGAPALGRSLPDWNVGRSNGFYLIADDAVGGFFAIDGGSLGLATGQVCYWAPDSLEWISLNGGYTHFLQWAMTGNLDEFYQDLRWPTWREDVAGMAGDRCFFFYPFLWAKEGSIVGSHRATVPVAEAYDSKVDIVRQLR